MIKDPGLLDVDAFHYDEYHEEAEQVVPESNDKFILKHKTDASKHIMITMDIEDEEGSKNLNWESEGLPGLPHSLLMDLNNKDKFEFGKKYPLTHLNTVINASRIK